MALAFVGESANPAATLSGTSATTQTCTRTVTAGNALIAFCMGIGTATTVTFSDGVNTWTTDTTLTPLGGGFQCLATGHALNVAGGSTTVTATWNASVHHSFVILVEVSGAKTASALEGKGGQFQNPGGTGTDALTSGNPSPAPTTTANTFVCGFTCNFNNNVAPTGVGTGFTQTGAVKYTSSMGGVQGEYKIVSATGTYPATFTCTTTSDNWSTFVVILAEAAAASQVPPPPQPGPRVAAAESWLASDVQATRIRFTAPKIDAPVPINPNVTTDRIAADAWEREFGPSLIRRPIVVQPKIDSPPLIQPLSTADRAAADSWTPEEVRPGRKQPLTGAVAPAGPPTIGAPNTARAAADTWPLDYGAARRPTWTDGAHDPPPPLASRAGAPAATWQPDEQSRPRASAAPQAPATVQPPRARSQVAPAQTWEALEAPPSGRARFTPPLIDQPAPRVPLARAAADSWVPAEDARPKPVQAPQAGQQVDNPAPRGTLATLRSAIESWASEYVAAIRRPTTVQRVFPVPVAGLKLWLRADLGVTLSGSNAVAWADQSGFGNDVVNVGTVPFVASSINGKPGLTCSASSGFQNTTSSPIAAGAPRTIFIVAKASSEFGGILYCNYSGAVGAKTQELWMMGATGSAPGFVYGGRGGATGEVDLTSVPVIARPLITRLSTTGGAGATPSVSLNGAAQSVSVAAAMQIETGAAGFGVGIRPYSTGSFGWPGDICEVLVFDSVLSPSDEVLVYGYLLAEYAINQVSLLSFAARLAAAMTWVLEDAPLRRTNVTAGQVDQPVPLPWTSTSDRVAFETWAAAEPQRSASRVPQAAPAQPPGPAVTSARVAGETWQGESPAARRAPVVVPGSVDAPPQRGALTTAGAALEGWAAEVGAVLRRVASVPGSVDQPTPRSSQTTRRAGDTWEPEAQWPRGAQRGAPQATVQPPRPRQSHAAAETWAPEATGPARRPPVTSGRVDQPQPWGGGRIARAIAHATWEVIDREKPFRALQSLTRLAMASVAHLRQRASVLVNPTGTRVVPVEDGPSTATANSSRSRAGVTTGRTSVVISNGRPTKPE